MTQRPSRTPPAHRAQATGSADPRRLATEDGLLLLLCRADPAAGAEEVAALLDRPVDWASLLESSVRHAVTPLLWRGLREAGAEGRVPAGTGREMADLSARAAARHRRLYGVLGDVVEVLDATGVAVLGLKDIDLAARLYPAPGLRPIGDLDLLVHRRDHAAAVAALAGLGFAAPPAGGLRHVLRYGDGHHVVRTADGVWIDLQWEVAHREFDVAGDAGFRFDVEGMWRRAERVAVEGVRLLVPGLEDMLVHLCVHLEGHRYAELVLLSDIDLLCTRRVGEIDWEAVVALARAQGAASSVERPLAMVRRLLGTPVPDDVLDRLAAPFVEAALHCPVFDAVAVEHSALDEIALAARPPEASMAALERTVRRRRRVASEACRRVGALAAAAAGGAGPAVVEVAAPAALVPDGGGPPGGPVRLLVPVEAGPAVRAAIDALPREVPIRSREELIEGDDLALRLRIAVDEGAGPVPPAPDVGGGNRAAALRTLRGRGVPGADEVAVTVLVRPREAIVAHLAAALAGAGEERLFQADPLLHALEAWDGRLDGGALADAVAVADGPAARGLALASALGGPVPPLPPRARPAPGAGQLPLFEWARYGGSQLRRDTALRAPFWFAYALTRARGVSERGDVLLEVVRPRRGPRALGPALARDLARGVARLVRPRPVDPRALAHWIEPDPRPPADHDRQR